jgi:hypothetical protein
VLFRNGEGGLRIALNGIRIELFTVYGAILFGGQTRLRPCLHGKKDALFYEDIKDKARGLFPIWSSQFKIELELRNVDFYGGKKTGEPGEKPSKQGRESTNNSTHNVELRHA